MSLLKTLFLIIRREIRQGIPTIKINRFHKPDQYICIFPAHFVIHYYKKFKLHREDGPAIIAFRKRAWFLNGKLIEVSSQKDFKKYLKLKSFW